MSTPVNPFSDSAAASIWSAQQLTRLRTEAAEETLVPDLLVDISKLDARIAAFETASIPATVTNATADYPFDRARLKREFLDEALALIIRASREVNKQPTDVPDAGEIRLNIFNPLTTATGTAGGAQFNLKGAKEGLSAASSVPTGGTQIFDNNDTRRTVLGPGGPGGSEPNPAAGGTYYETYLYEANSTDPLRSTAIYEAYASLIDAAFAAGDKLANQTLAPSQVVTGIGPTTVAGTTFDRIASYSDITNRDAARNPLLTQYLVSSDVATEKASGGTTLSGSGGSGGRMLKLEARATTAVGTAGAYTLYQNSAGVRAAVAQDAAGNVTALGSLDGVNYVAATKVSIPLSVAYGLGVTPAPSDGNLPIALDAYRFTGSDGFDYLIGHYDASAGGSDRVFTYKLDPAFGGIANVKSLTAPEYLLHWNEARIKVLTGQLNYQKNIITEIQTDLAQANDALAELQKQYAALGTNTADTHYSAATLKLSLFNATHATAGNPFLPWDDPTTRDQMYSSMEWETIRVSFKNYIDRRSSEAQQATLDYQSTLNRYNSAYEIMGKMQEKLDNLVKSQLRNIT